MRFDAIDGEAFLISLQVGTVGAALCVVVGTPVAYWLSRTRPRIAIWISTLVLLPLILPPTAVGYYLLYVLGQESPTGRFLINDVGLRLVFTWPGAAIAAAIVSFPLYVRTAQAGFEQVDPVLTEMASTLAGRWTSFTRVVVPLCWPSLVAATLIAFARSVGEFGATVVVAGSIPGVTRTVPAAIYDAAQAGDTARANALAFAVLVLGFVVLALLSYLFQRQRSW
jgi:molybdate transport system permease protein